MDIKNKRILVLGGFGLVGQAVIRRLMLEKPAYIALSSLNREEAVKAVAMFEKEYASESTNWEAVSGNVFVRDQWKNLPREAILSDTEKREQLIADILGDLTEDVLTSNALYSMIDWTRPDAIIDCINTSTAIAYQDLFTLSQRVQAATKSHSADANELVGRLLSSLYIPQLIRHVQILNRALVDFKINAYIKIGTSGTGGMGLNIPFTHSEERPSRVLLSKSSVAGAHSLLLFLMARTPNTATIVKEIKPTATIAWKEVGYGKIAKAGKPIELIDVDFDSAQTLGDSLKLLDPTVGRASGKMLEAVYIDTGENGIFSKGEFETISALGQMELITPEEIAENIARELLGASTGKDIVAALDASTMGPTYRAGYLRESAIQAMSALEQSTGTESIAFEMLGPPRLAKLLYEAHLLKHVARSFEGVLDMDEKALAEGAETFIRNNAQLRSEIISIGIPILLKDGEKLLRGPVIKIPPAKVEKEVQLTHKLRDQYAREGWVDLRASNMKVWQERLTAIKKEIESTKESTGSHFDRLPSYWDNFQSLSEGRLAAWIFTIEEGGKRIKR